MNNVLDSGDSADPENLAELAADVERLRAKLTSMKSSIALETRKRAGDYFDKLVDDTSFCKHQIVYAESPDVAWAALQIFLASTAQDQETSGFLKAVLENKDAHASVRALAARGLFSHYLQTKEPWIPLYFANIVAEGREDFKILRVCYYNILDTLNIDVDLRPSYRAFLYPSDVQWSYLADIRHGR